tara:strand:+ start:511 stop:981 length:471 start_codon:yes stop_codon:yes gene_type:complete
MKFLFTLILSFFFISFNANSEKSNPDYQITELILFDAVEKNLLFQTKVPNNFKRLINNWFAKNVKVSGFEGKLEVIFDKFSENLIDIEDGKNYEIQVDLRINIINKGLSNKKSTKISLREFSEITGYFKLSEVDEMIEFTQVNLVKRLNDKLSKNN